MDRVRARFQVTLPWLLRVGFRRAPWAIGLWSAIAVATFLGFQAYDGRNPMQAQHAGIMSLLAVAALVGGAALVAASALLTYVRLRPQQRDIEIELGPEGATWADADGSQSLISWSAIRRVTETPSMLLIKLRTGATLYTPTSAFPGELLGRTRAIILASGAQARLR